MSRSELKLFINTFLKHLVNHSIQSFQNKISFHSGITNEHIEAIFGTLSEMLYSTVQYYILNIANDHMIGPEMEKEMN